MKFESELLDTLKEFKLLGINEQLDYEKFYLYSIITHSTALEGSTVTEIENQLLFDEGLACTKPIKEQLMNLDLKNAYEKGFELAQNHEKISVENLCLLSSILMKNTGSEYSTIYGNFSSSKDEFRLLNVSAGRGGKSYLEWQKIPQKLNEMCNYINERREKLNAQNIYEIYKLSFEAHYLLVSIHPWVDGNGRMSRLLMNMIQKEFGVALQIVKKENRVQYIQSLASSQEKNDSSEFIDFMFAHHLQNLKAQIAQYKIPLQNDTLKIQDDTLKAQNDTLFSEKEKIIFEIIKTDLSITAEKICEKTQFSRPTVMRAIKSLKEKNVLKRLDSKKTGSWQVLS